MPQEGVVLQSKVRRAVQNYSAEVYRRTRHSESNTEYLSPPVFRPSLNQEELDEFVQEPNGRLFFFYCFFISQLGKVNLL